MMKIINCFLFTWLVFSSVYSQDLKLMKLSKSEVKAGVLKKYTNTDSYEGGVILLLYKDKKYHYSVRSTNYDVFSHGTWSDKKKEILLTSDILNDAVPVKVQYVNSNDSVVNYPFLIPLNLKGEKLFDSRIFINNDTATYCFPFFDTCVGNYALMDKIRINFGDGYMSNWVKLDSMNTKKILIVAQVDFMFTSYLAFNRRRYKVVGLELKLDD